MWSVNGGNNESGSNGAELRNRFQETDSSMFAAFREHGLPDLPAQRS